MIGGSGVWKVLAPVDLAAPHADESVGNALDLATSFGADVTLLSVVERRRYERGVRRAWPRNAFGSAHPELDIHRVALPGTPAQAISRYADQIRADIVLVPADYRVRQMFRKHSVAECLAPLTSRAMWITPANPAPSLGSASPRVACIIRLDGTDERVFGAAQAVIDRRGGELALAHLGNGSSGQSGQPAAVAHSSKISERAEYAARSVSASWNPSIFHTGGTDELVAAAKQRRIGLLVAGRAMYVPDKTFRDMLVIAARISCPLLSVPLSAVSTGTSMRMPHTTHA